MALDVTGVKLVAEGQSEYLAALRAARDATLAFNNASGSASAGAQQLSGSSMTLAVTAGNLLANAFQTVTSQIVNFSKGAIDSASKLQDVKLQLENLTAAELVQSGAMTDMNQAIAASGPIADDIMDKLKALSLASPFEYQQILSAYMLQRQFGQTSDSAVDLTRAITNLGAANKTIPNVVERVSYSLGQMNLMGKIGGQEVRELAMAGVNLGKMLQESFGKSIDQVNEDLKSGKMTMEDVSKAFVGYVDKYFSTAAERASKTFSGLVSSFKDLSFFSSIDIFGGSLEVVTKNLGELFTTAQNFINAGGLKPIGAGLEVLTEGLFGIGKAALSAGQDFYNKFGSKIAETASSAFNWGSNVVIQFAAGMIEGAASALAAAMDFLSGYLTFWMAPGSPPKVAPDIDKWGTSAMSEFLRGFTEADFSVLGSAESAIQSALSALVGGGLIDSKDQLGIFQNLSGGLAEALAGGGSITPVLDNIRASLGDYGSEVATLIEKQAALAVATENVKKAEDALKASREQEDKANENLLKTMDEYNALAKAGASPEVLAAKRKEYELAKQQRQAAHDAGKQAEKDLETAQAEQDELKKKADLQEQLLKQLIELTKAQKDQDKDKDKGTGTTKTAAPEIPKMDQAKADMAKAMEDLKSTIREKFKNAFQPLVDAWEKAKAIVQPAWERFTGVLSQAWDDFMEKTKPIREWLQKVIPPDFLKNIGWAAGLVGTFALGFVILKGIILGLAPVFAVLFSPITLLVGAIILLVAVIKTYGPQAWETIQTLGKIIRVVFSRMWDNIKKFFGDLKSNWSKWWNNLFQAVGNFVSDVVKKWGKFWDDLVDGAGDAWDDIKKAVENGVDDVIDGIVQWGKDVIDAVGDWWADIKDAVKGAWDGIVSAVQTAVTGSGGLVDKISGWWTNVVTAVQSWWNAVTNAVSGAWSGITTNIQTAVTGTGGLTETMSGWWSSVVAAVQNWWNQVSSAVSGAWDGIITSIQTAVTGKDGLTDTISGWWSSIVSAVGTWWTEVGNAVSGAWTGTVSIVSKLYDAVFGTGDSSVVAKIKGWASSIVSAVGTWWTSVGDAVSGAWTGTVSIVSKLYDAVLGTGDSTVVAKIKGWASSIVSAVGTWWTGIKDALPAAWSNIVQGIINAVLGALGFSTSSIVISNATLLGNNIGASIAGGIAAELTQASLTLPGIAAPSITPATAADALSSRLSLATAPAAASVQRNYNLTLNTPMSADTVEQGFDYFRLLGA